MDKENRRKIRIVTSVIHVLLQLMMMSFIYIKVSEFHELANTSHYIPLVEIVAFVGYMIGIYMIYITVSRLISRRNISG